MRQTSARLHQLAELKTCPCCKGIALKTPTLVGVSFCLNVGRDLPVNKNNVGAVRTKSVTARTMAQTVTAQTFNRACGYPPRSWESSPMKTRSSVGWVSAQRVNPTTEQVRHSVGWVSLSRCASNTCRRAKFARQQNNVGAVRRCLQFSRISPSLAGRTPQRTSFVRRVCGGVADTHAGI